MPPNKPHHGEDATEVISNADGVTIKPRGLNIIWGSDRRYWHLPDIGKDDPAELAQVCWLEVTGSTKVQRGKRYKIGFTISMKPDAFGWSGSPVYMMAKLGKKGRYTKRTINSLDQLGSNKETQIPEENFEISVGNQDEDELYFGLYEVWNGKWKGGLKIHNAFVKEVK